MHLIDRVLKNPGTVPGRLCQWVTWVYYILEKTLPRFDHYSRRQALDLVPDCLPRPRDRVHHRRLVDRVLRPM